ncbi:MAG TPA: hypothetical protein PLK99_03905, partial [Burkholderiales bacterium]|nr:hypothetical protein [Burkholderiales bacterium]
MRRLEWIFLIFLLSFPAQAADKGIELERLHAALDMLIEQQQATYQQFQMVENLLHSNDDALYGAQGHPTQTPGAVQNYDDVVEAQKKLVRRGESLYRQAEDLLEKYRKIQEEKSVL